MQTALTLKKKFQLTNTITLSLFALLIAQFIVTHAYRSTGFNWPVLALQTLPLLALLPSLLKHHYRSYSWLCFILLLYFIVAVMEVSASNATLSDNVFLCITCFLFISSMLCSRYAQRVQKGLDDHV